MNRNVTLHIDKSRFNYRVAGVVIEDGYVLLHRMETDDFWALPGGRCEIGEQSNLAVAREFAEELGATVRVERMLWSCELFFNFRGYDNHEMGFYYKVSFSDPTFMADKTKTYEGVEGDFKLIYKWFPLTEIANMELYPIFLRDGLQTLPETVQHLIHHE